MGSVAFGSYETAAATHVGRVRQRNEDAYLLRPEVGLWAVADGMGGHHSGDLASQTIIDSLKSIQPQGTAADLLAACENHVASANQRLKEIGKARGGVIVGATLAALLVFEDFYACLWSGDSRIYMIRGGTITQLSEDHTETQELVAAGTITAQEAQTWPRGNIVTRAIGVFEEPEIEITSGPLLNGDTFLVCSDGLTRHVADTEILSCVSSEPAQQVCDNLISLALERGGLDNVTVVVMHYCPTTAPSKATQRSDQSIERG
jgi:protein phosphatase